MGTEIRVLLPKSKKKITKKYPALYILGIVHIAKNFYFLLHIT